MKNMRLLFLAILALSSSLAFANNDIEVMDASYQQGQLVVDWKHTVDIDQVVSYTMHGYGPTGGGTYGVYELTSGSATDFLNESVNNTHYFTAVVNSMNAIPEKVFVAAMFENGDTLGSHGYYVDTTNGMELYFYAVDDVVAFGETYSFVPQVPGFKLSDLDFELVSSPPGVDLDTYTGALSWVPAESDIHESYTFELKVSTKDGEQSYTGAWEVSVAECLQNLSVFVVDPEQNPLQQGKVSLYQWSENANNTLMQVATKPVAPNSFGEVAFSVLPGEYLVEFVDLKEEFEREWYLNAAGVEDAQLVTVECEQPQEIVMQVELVEQEEMVRFTGSVEMDGNPTQGKVTVEFIGINTNLPQDEQLENAYYFRKDIWLTPAGATMYTIDVPAAYHYYAKVEPAKGAGSLQIDPEFFEEAETMADAVLLAPTDVNVTVDFTPSLSTFGLGGIYGTVYSVDGEVVPSQVVATRTTSNSGAKWSFRAKTETNDTGAFVFNMLPDGEFILQALPLPSSSESQYLPGYYNGEGDGVAVDTWSEATIVVVNGQMVSKSHDIILSSQTIESQEEDRTIAGVVTKTNGEIKHGGGEVAAGNSVEEANVVVRGNGLVVYGTTTSEGSYAVGGLEPGLYTMTVDFPGLELFQTTIEIGAHEFEVTKDVTMKGAVTSVEDEQLTSEIWIEQGILHVDAEVVSTISIDVYSINGLLMSSAEGNTMSIGNLPSGTYMVVVEMAEKVEIHSFQLAK